MAFANKVSRAFSRAATVHALPFATNVVEAHAMECIRTWLILSFSISSNKELNTSKKFQPCKSSPVKLVTDEDLHG